MVRTSPTPQSFLFLIATSMVLLFREDSTLKVQEFSKY